MRPEQQARQHIDLQLIQCGWCVQACRTMSISASLGVAVREFLLRIGSADCMLYVDCRAVSVVEDKPEGHTLIGVEPQSAKYQDLGSRFGDRPRRTEVALPHGLQTK